MRRALVAIGLLAATGALLAGTQDRPAPSRAPGSQAPRSGSPQPANTPAPPRLPLRAIDRQDRTSGRHRRHESDALDRRPLLTRLPVRDHGVQLDIGGLAPDARHTIISIDPGRRPRAHAREIFRRQLRRTGDQGTSYRLEWAR